MSDKRILVWCPFPLLERNGGPSTYLYNLKQGLNSSNFPIDYLSDILSIQSQKTDLPKGKRDSTRVPNFLLKVFRYLRSLKYALNGYSPIEYILQIDLNDYKAIHFHSTHDLIKARKQIKDYRGKIILTTHTPCPPYQHELNHLELSKENMPSWFFRKILKLDYSAFEKADIIILPCKEAIESYYDGYLPYFNLAELVEKKQLVAIPTGTSKANSKEDSRTIREKLNIPESAFVIYYSGRHNEEKGYDLLVKAAKSIISKSEQVYFLITGKTNEAIPYPISKQWIEIGWTNDPFSYANASDIFILPNRQTYFDLVLIEILSLALPVIISRIGGNKYFEDKHSLHSLFYFQPDNLIDLIHNINHCFENRGELKRSTLLYEKYLSLNAFCNQYAKSYSEILAN